MARRLITDDLWRLLEQYLPSSHHDRKRGRPAVPDRDVLAGILLVLKTGITWEDLPEEMGSGCGMTALRRLRQWQDMGVWQKIQPILESRLECGHRIDWDRANRDTRRIQPARNHKESGNQAF